jgi:NAD(P)-dependent dehydrogenase (short-subunit alcohol dehydrogenase family)
MDVTPTSNLFDLRGRVAVVTGGAGVLCSSLCRILAVAGVRLAILDLNQTAAEELASEINQAGGEALAIKCDVGVKNSIQLAAQQVMRNFGRVDILINGAGGNQPQATTNADLLFFDLPEEAMQWVFNLNLFGTILSCQVFGEAMARQKKGVILNISSMNASRPLTRIPAYSAAKAAVSNFTQWLAVHMAQEYSADIRVNAIAPGFFLTEQNRYLVLDQATDQPNERGLKIIAHTPMKRFGVPDDLAGTVMWLLSAASSFVTGIVVPVDGGFSAFSGV